ncbi:type II toxin-antitoxin system RelE/ParE family toxin [Ochrobactrum chromiisoli]|uniref:Type II toxin-antitoxin system RelE/ParE family toxin n=1 Tax=Ochrobactrum chromiisoli TaxID=2993941 RepID=A0ABT3QUJ4_9HYPH|nr:type II toxin-antitoxin system RelE/ParE family toxin [Ochrobactrum chromiisoli]MCX2699292.1 type II toxin-antitoxin system RelE/ParE family toxin [Ochrobactrum chromiisoli]
MTEDERLRLNNLLAESPMAGELIQGTGGARKLRFAKPGKGKSGSYRIITYYAAEDVPVFIMDVYAKGEKINLSAAEKAELKKILSSVAEDWRASVREKVKEMRTAS